MFESISYPGSRPDPIFGQDLGLFMSVQLQETRQSTRLSQFLLISFQFSLFWPGMIGLVPRFLFSNFFA